MSGRPSYLPELSPAWKAWAKKREDKLDKLEAKHAKLRRQVGKHNQKIAQIDADILDVKKDLLMMVGIVR